MKDCVAVEGQRHYSGCDVAVVRVAKGVIDEVEIVSDVVEDAASHKVVHIHHVEATSKGQHWKVWKDQRRCVAGEGEEIGMGCIAGSMGTLQSKGLRVGQRANIDNGIVSYIQDGQDAATGHKPDLELVRISWHM